MVAKKPWRLVVIGKNSILWSRIGDRVRSRHLNTLAVGHRDLASVRLNASDRIWIFSYAQDVNENAALFDVIAAQGGSNCYYLSSATANIADNVRCYRYPLVKRAGELDAELRLGAIPVRIGLIHDNTNELPAGNSAVTQLDLLIEAMISDDVDFARCGSLIQLYTLESKLFSSAMERFAYIWYGKLLRACGSYPCVLRPLDVVLKLFGWRWYGYFRMSNDICFSTI